MTNTICFNKGQNLYAVLLACGLSLAVLTTQAGAMSSATKSSPQAKRAPVPAAKPATPAAKPATPAAKPGTPAAPGAKPGATVPPKPGTPGPRPVGGVPPKPGSVPPGGSTHPGPGTGHPPVVPQNHPVQIGHPVTHELPGGGHRTTVALPGGRHFSETVHPAPGGGSERIASRGPGHVVVERPIFNRNGYYRHSVFIGGRSTAVVYRGYSYHGAVFYRPVPAYIYAPGFYAWGFQPWGPGVVYGWGWGAQPWYSVYGGVFTPYQTYGSLDLWMTDYVIAANLQRAYDAGQASAAQQGPGPSTMVAQPADAAAGAPPAITPEMKAQIAEQVKLEMQDQQKLAATGPSAVAPPPDAAGATPPEQMPDALKDGHTLFRVVSPLSLKAGNETCTLTPDDYITRTGTLSNDGTVPVTVKASRAADCPQGANTTVALNDLMAMESDQQERIMEGLQVASQHVGKNGLPPGPASGATPVPAGQTVPDPGLSDKLRQQQGDASEDTRTSGAGSM
jgi:hypothetical protein